MKRAVICLFFVLAACEEENREAPPPVAIHDEAVGYYCQMLVHHHSGPKGQIHLSESEEPLWFVQVRDAIAYIKSEERSSDVLAFYVSDMAAAASWEDTGAENWINAHDAWFVVGADVVGGMGAPELVPFAMLDKAQSFAAERGGEVRRLQEVEIADVLSPIDINEHTSMEP